MAAKSAPAQKEIANAEIKDERIKIMLANFSPRASLTTAKFSPILEGNYSTLDISKKATSY